MKIFSFPFGSISLSPRLLFILLFFLSKTTYTQEIFELKIDSIIYDAIDSAAFPGAQILIIKDGEIVFEKAYGHHTYEEIITVELNHLYDL